MSKELNALKGMKQLQNFPPYLKLCNEIELQIQDLDAQILDTIWENELKYTYMDLKKVERLLLKQFLELPENIISSFDNIVETVDKEED